MKIILVLISMLLFTDVIAQQTFDLFTFKSPDKWDVSEKENNIIFSTTNNNKGTWAQIDIVKSTTSKGNIKEDFESEWKTLVIDRYGVTGQPIMVDTQSFKGWQVRTGLAKFKVNKDTASLILNTFSDGTRCASFILISNTTGYGPILDEFISSINLKSENDILEHNSDSKPKSETGSAKNQPDTIRDGYEFTTTNFNDGWTSVVKEDWVEATKGSIKVLLHYPRPEDSKYYTQYNERMSVFWNMLVAPRYSDLRQYETPGSNLAEPAYFAGGLLRDNQTGKDVWVTLFNKGKSGWIEIISPDKNSFVKAFGINNPHAYFTEWEPLINLSGLNRFAVGANDLVGKWSNEFQGSTYYVNVYTGFSAGATSFASRVNFLFQKNKTYNWDLAMASGSTGTMMKVDNAKASGTWKMLNNWQIWFSEIERSAKTYNAYFSCVKGGRILWLQDTSYGNYTSFGRISK